MKNARDLRLALAGGGTGGHVVPGARLVRAAARRGVLADLVWFGTGRAAEERALASVRAAAGDVPFEHVALALEPEGGGAPSRARTLAAAPLQSLRARAVLARHRTAVVLGLGGFTVLPAALAALSRGTPLALLEINAAAGRATRRLAPFAARVFHAWDATMPARPSAKHVRSGPPLDDELLAPAPGRPAPAAGRLLVLGGSQGAGGLNAFVRAHAAALLAGGAELVHQVGPGRLAEAAAPHPRYRAVEYLDDVPAELRAATLVLTRGGASTLVEVAALRRAALVVPYPHHADRHQERNARQLGAGVVIVDEERLDGAVAARLAELAGERGASERAAMERALAGALPLDGTERILDALVELARAD